MQIARLQISNFRGIQDGEIFFNGHTLLVGDNNSGKSTILEAIDLVLGPERLGRSPVVNEHDFYAGKYIGQDLQAIEIRVEAIVTGLSEDQCTYFRNNLEWWDANACQLIQEPPEFTDSFSVVPAIRVFFQGAFDQEEDDFRGNTFFASPPLEDGSFQTFRVKDKRLCGFLFLRTLRTGRRALSLEHGSLLDIILRLQENRTHIWEDILNQLRSIPVAAEETLGVSNVLLTVQEAVKSYVHSNSVQGPHLRISDLTRESLRKILTVFVESGAALEDNTPHSVPFYHQGTGTINTLVLALLSQIAELKQNVIFAMEEPEIAIAPHTQKRIVDSVKQQSAQALFTTHSPYVLEEFLPENVLNIRREGGKLLTVKASLPPTVKLKAYKTELRQRLCEALLAMRILIVEGRTEYDAIRAVSRRLNELDPSKHKTIEALGIAVVNAETDSQVAPLGKYYRDLGKQVFAIFDLQEATAREQINCSIAFPYENPEAGFEELLLKQCSETALRRFAASLVSEGSWPNYLYSEQPNPSDTTLELVNKLRKYLIKKKGEGACSELLESCELSEMPKFLVATLQDIQSKVEPEIESADSPISFADLI